MRSSLSKSLRKAALGSTVGFQPSLELDFLNQKYKSLTGTVVTSKTFAELITFTRASIGWRYNSLGLLESMAVDAPRFSYDPGSVSTSATSAALVSGRKTFAVTYLYKVGQTLRITNDTTHYMTGYVVAATAGSVTVVVGTNIVGTGTFTAWTLIVSKGLLVEEARTNLAPYSSDFTQWGNTGAGAALTIAAADSAGPRGPLTMTKVTRNDLGVKYLTRTFTAGTAVTVTGTIYAKAGTVGKYLAVRLQATFPARVDARFNLETGQVVDVITSGDVTAPVATMLHVGGGVYRCRITGLSGATAWTNMIVAGHADLKYVDGTPTGLADWWMDGAQVEVGAYPTTPIATTTAAVTRALDVANVATMSPWYNAAEGTLYAEFSQDYTGASGTGIARRACALNGSASDYIEINRGTSGSMGASVVTGGSSQTAFGGTPVADRTPGKVAIGYKANDCASSVNGTPTVYDTAATLFTATTLAIGQRGSAQAPLTGEVRVIRYNPKRLDPQALTVISA